MAFSGCGRLDMHVGHSLVYMFVSDRVANHRINLLVVIKDIHQRYFPQSYWKLPYYYLATDEHICGVK